jgi:RNA polymerase sigma factor (sigma-70 family)
MVTASAQRHSDPGILDATSHYSLMTQDEFDAAFALFGEAQAAAVELASAKHLSQRRTLELKRLVADGESVKWQVVLANVRLIVKLAKVAVAKAHTLTFEELMDEGVFGLTRAFEKFDPSKGFRFSTYATWWIRQFINRAMEHQDRMVRLPHSASTQRDALLARRVTTLLGRQTVSLDWEDEDHTPLYEMFASSEDVSEEATGSGAVEHLDSILGDLTPRDRVIFVLRNGLLDGNDMTASEIAEHFGISTSLVRNSDGKTKARLRHPCHGVLVDSEPWQQDAACRGLPDSIFFPGRGNDERKAKETCGTCPVRDHCRDYAAEHGVKFGFWGQSTPIVGVPAELAA